MRFYELKIEFDEEEKDIFFEQDEQVITISYDMAQSVISALNKIVANQSIKEARKNINQK